MEKYVTVICVVSINGHILSHSYFIFSLSFEFLLPMQYYQSQMDWLYVCNWRSIGFCSMFNEPIELSNVFWFSFAPRLYFSPRAGYFLSSILATIGMARFEFIDWNFRAPGIVRYLIGSDESITFSNNESWILDNYYQ